MEELRDVHRKGGSRGTRREASRRGQCSSLPTELRLVHRPRSTGPTGRATSGRRLSLTKGTHQVMAAYIPSGNSGFFASSSLAQIHAVVSGAGGGRTDGNLALVVLVVGSNTRPHDCRVGVVVPGLNDNTRRGNEPK